MQITFRSVTRCLTFSVFQESVPSVSFGTERSVTHCDAEVCILFTPLLFVSLMTCV